MKTTLNRSWAINTELAENTAGRIESVGMLVSRCSNYIASVMQEESACGTSTVFVVRIFSSSPERYFHWQGDSDTLVQAIALAELACKVLHDEGDLQNLEVLTASHKCVLCSKL